MTHGLRPTYAAGCRCLRCRAANARYITTLRRKKLAGTLILGAIRSAKEVQQMLKALHREHVTNTQLAHELGLHSAQVKVHPRITVRKHLRIQRVYDKFMREGPTS